MTSLSWKMKVGFVSLAGGLVLIVVAAATARASLSFHRSEVVALLDEDYGPAVVQQIRKAKSRIRCALYMARFDPRFPNNREGSLLVELAAARRRGVDVSVILDGSDRPWEDAGSPMGVMKKEHTNSAAFKFLKRNGVNVVYESEDALLHSKLIIIDNEISIVGSTNWTYSALAKNREASVIVRSAEVARAFGAGLDDIQTRP